MKIGTTGLLRLRWLLHRILSRVLQVTDEDGFFEVWYSLDRLKRWRALYGNDDMPDRWGDGFKAHMLNAWTSRASLHVTHATSELKFPGLNDRCVCNAGHIAPLWSYSPAKHRIFCSYCGEGYKK